MLTFCIAPRARSPNRAQDLEALQEQLTKARAERAKRATGEAEAAAKAAALAPAGGQSKRKRGPKSAAPPAPAAEEGKAA